MYKTLLACVLLVTASCSTNSVSPDAQRQRAVSDSIGWRQQNDLALPQAKRLATTHTGSWVLIAGGELLGPWKNFDDAWARAAQIPDEQDHAYLYRLGVDDVDQVFFLSPFLDSDPHWVQLGTRCWGKWGLTIAAANNVWFRNGKSVTWGDMEAQLHLFTPEDHAESLVRAVASSLFDGDLTLRPSDATILGLGRFTAPGFAYANNKNTPCEKVLVLIRVPELDIDVPAIAYILGDYSERR